MAIGTYLELKEKIQRLAKRTDILSQIDDYIDQAEADMWTDLKVRDLEGRSTATADTTDRFLALPDDFLIMRVLRLKSGGNSYDLEFRTPETLIVQPAAGRPQTFAVTSQLAFDRVPDSAYTLEMEYYKQITPLSSSNPTNTILTRFPNIYLYGSLVHFAQDAHNNDMLVKYSALYDSAVRKANLRDRKGRHGPAPAMRSEVTTP